MLCKQQSEEEKLKILEECSFTPFQEFRTKERDGTFTREQKFRTMESKGKYMNLRVGIVSPYPYAHDKFEEPKMYYWLTFTHWELAGPNLSEVFK
ncbi:hypothetical protein SS1G_09220 [Sclerotinia sclerotiorum 1980 UF-70]|uniref:Uncharacterized protein n=1 Tax=Sclerotinia sclerotiorum (strain ATCC 18683 / 1980 / Ss-1) TaxID=665079 RepID=A7EV62_SCLS1|nr:hypothetical protein SS1G_09220 [Sclerotinia sclerotiorum 1980 UF-70]EDN93354.1 hypothetical protein SS1G_09220 [Sclerotinia sclerotiorum 1980 UF-70]